MANATIRYGLTTFFMGVRSDPQQRINPVFLCNDEVKEFLALYIGKTPEQMVRMFEVWAINGDAGELVGSRISLRTNEGRSSRSFPAQEHGPAQAGVPSLHPDEAQCVLVELCCLRLQLTTARRHYSYY